MPSKSNFHKNLKNQLNKKPIQEIYRSNFTYKTVSVESYLINFSEEIFNIFDEIFHEMDVFDKFNLLFESKIINPSENQAAEHYRYRKKDISDEEFSVDDNLNKIKKIVSNRNPKKVFVFGIGGSYEGPKLLLESIKLTRFNAEYFFITGSDEDELNAYHKDKIYDDENLYFFISKSFKSIETLNSFKKIQLNNQTNNCIAITANANEAMKHGFKNQNIINFPETIGGRYSIWSQSALPIISDESYKNFLRGGRSADELLFGSKDYLRLLKLLSFYDIWSSNYLNSEIRVILSYLWIFRSLPDYLQQLEMESLGKFPHPESIFTKTGKTIYGGFGPIAQHSYFQLLHQGTSNAISDIISYKGECKTLISIQANAQADLLSGIKKHEKGPSKVNSNISVNHFELKEKSEFELGWIIATWEHRVFLTSQMLSINPFDQFGVNAGKLATEDFLKL